VRYIEGKFSNK